MRYLVTTATLQDCVDKVNFELGGGASNQSTRIRHREARGMDREDTQEEGGRDLDFSWSLRSGKCGKKDSWLVLWSFFDQVFTPNFWLPCLYWQQNNLDKHFTMSLTVMQHFPSCKQVLPTKGKASCKCAVIYYRRGWDRRVKSFMPAWIKYWFLVLEHKETNKAKKKKISKSK